MLTPFGDLRFFKRGIQGLINQSEELDELLAKLFKDMQINGKLVRIADDLFIGGLTIDDTLDNWKEFLEICATNNIKLSVSKTIMFPKTVVVLRGKYSSVYASLREGKEISSGEGNKHPNHY